jgi:hypothetical protein
MSDLCTAIWKESVIHWSNPIILVLLLIVCLGSYTENFVTDGEFAALPPRLQEQVKRAAAHNGQRDWNVYYTPAALPTRFKRVGE